IIGRTGSPGARGFLDSLAPRRRSHGRRRLGLARKSRPPCFHRPRRIHQRVAVKPRRAATAAASHGLTRLSREVPLNTTAAPSASANLPDFRPPGRPIRGALLPLLVVLVLAAPGCDKPDSKAGDGKGAPGGAAIGYVDLRD